MECHPACDMFPPMSPADFASLCEDIAKHGQRETIKTHLGQIVDGRHRYNACCSLGIAPRFEEWDGNGSLVAYVVSLNLHRRHLDTSQRAAVAAEVKPMLEDEGRERQRAAAKKTNASRWDESLCPNSDEATEPWDSLDEAAEMFNVGRGTVADACRVKAEAPDEFERIKRGETTVHAARRRLAEANGHAKPRKADAHANCLHLDIDVSDDPATYYDDIARGLATYCPLGEPYDRLIAAMNRYRDIA